MIKSFVSLVIVTFATQVFYSQNVAASEREIRTRRERAESILARVPSSQLASEERVDPESGKFVHSATRTREFAPPDRERTTAEVVQKNGTRKKFYSIKIGDLAYIKSGDGPWEQMDEREFQGPIAGIQVSAEYSFLGEEKLEGASVKVFKVRSTFGYKPKEARGGNDTTYYFDKEGRLMKKVVVTFNSDGPTGKITTEYTYPANITIEVPIP